MGTFQFDGTVDVSKAPGTFSQCAKLMYIVSQSNGALHLRQKGKSNFSFYDHHIVT